MSRRQLVESLTTQFPVLVLCRALDMSPSAYYYVPHRQDNLIRVVERRRMTTNSRHSYPRYPNLVCGLAIDISYIQLRQGFVYLAIVMDVCTRGLRGWQLGRTLSSDLAIDALERALSRGVPEIHHSDQGVQYAVEGYTGCLERLGIQISMASPGQPTDNPYAERVIRTIKEEEMYLAD